MSEPYQILEEELAKWAGTDPEKVVVCNSGTAALHLSLEALQLPIGSEVILPDLTMIACARAVVLAGLTPVFVDCMDNLLIDPWLTARRVAPRTKAIMAVHIYGRHCNMEFMAGSAEGAGIALIEDLAEAHGIRPHPRTDAAIWSFYRNKIVSGEEGGAIAFRDATKAAFARKLRSLGFTEAHDFTHISRGHNYRMSNIHASLILDSLKKVDTTLFFRREIEQWYDHACPKEWRMIPRQVPWVYDLRIPGMTSEKQNEVVRSLREFGIQARHCFKPMTIQEEFIGCETVGNRKVCGKLSQEVIYLPIESEIPMKADVAQAFKIIEKVCR